MKLKPVLLIAAGGTGGHMFPAQALAWEFKKLGWSVVLVTDKRGARFSDTFPPEVTKFVQNSSSLRFRDPLRIPKAIYLICSSIFQAFYVFMRLKPRVAIGFGGYPSFAAILIAKVLNVKSILHEQNAVLGRVNRIFSRRVDAVACSFWPTKAPPGTIMRFTGNPIRNTLINKNIPSFYLPSKGPLNLVIIGGSQGARIFSKIVPEAVELLPKTLTNRFKIFQQARLEDRNELEKKYKEIGVSSTVEDFFQNIEKIFSSAHLIIARAGASTIAEVLFFGKPLLLIPIPFSLGDHQKLNAQRISDLGAAICLEENTLTGLQLAKKISAILENQRLAHNLAKAASKNARPQAIQSLRDLVLDVSEGHLVAK